MRFYYYLFEQTYLLKSVKTSSTTTSLTFGHLDVFKKKLKHVAHCLCLPGVLYEMTTLHHAFDGNNLPALIAKIMKGVYAPIDGRFGRISFTLSFFDKNYFTSASSLSYSSDLKQLIACMLREQPAHRPELSAILALPFLQPHVHAYRALSDAYVPPPRPTPRPSPRLEPPSQPTSLTTSDTDSAFDAAFDAACGAAFGASAGTSASADAAVDAALDAAVRAAARCHRVSNPVFQPPQPPQPPPQRRQVNVRLVRPSPFRDVIAASASASASAVKATTATSATSSSPADSVFPAAPTAAIAAGHSPKPRFAPAHARVSTGGNNGSGGGGGGRAGSSSPMAAEYEMRALLLLSCVFFLAVRHEV